MSIQIIYFSNYSGNTHRFVEKLGMSAVRIPILWDPAHPVYAGQEYVLLVPTYGGGSESPAIPKQVKKFLNIPANRDLLRGVIGFGNTNFGEHFCKAADIVSAKTGVPVVGRVEIFGTNEDVIKIKERLEILYG
jgi:protein involved in ribonucleotide reduction